MLLKNILDEIGNTETRLKSPKLCTEIKDQGRNNSIYKLEYQDGSKYALKIYRTKNSKKKSERMMREVLFYRHLKTTKVKKPRLIQYSEMNTWILTDWIDGEKKKGIKKDDIPKIIGFLEETNKDVGLIELMEASDAFIDLKRMRNAVESSLSRTDKYLEEKKRRNVKEWFNSNVLSSYNTYIERNNKISELNILEDRKLHMATQSDVGVHNTIVSEGNLVFIDYEHAGMDNIIKTVCDWVLQPNYPWDQELEDEFIEKLMISLKYNKKLFVAAYNIIKPIAAIKWCCIITSHSNNMESEEEQIKLIDAYINKINCLK